MNLEQIVKETVAKIVAEKKGKDLTGDGKIDSADYLKARDIAIKKAEGNMDEARFEKGEDVGGKGFEFKDIAKKAAKQYGSKEAGQRVAGAILKKVLNKEGDINEDYEVAMAQDSLDSIIRAAMMLKLIYQLGFKTILLTLKTTLTKQLKDIMNLMLKWLIMLVRRK